MAQDLVAATEAAASEEASSMRTSAEEVKVLRTLSSSSLETTHKPVGVKLREDSGANVAEEVTSVCGPC